MWSLGRVALRSRTRNDSIIKNLQNNNNITKIFGRGSHEKFVNIFVNSLKKDYVENGKVEFSSTVKPFYDRNIKTHEICFAAGKRNL